MSIRFSTPFPQFFNSIPQVLADYRLFFYAAGTSTKLDTYSDAAETVPNTNPVVLNSAGYPGTDIFLKNQAYKVVLAPPAAVGVDDPPLSPIWTADNYYGTDLQTVVQTLTGSGSPTGVVAGTAGSAGVLPTFYWDYTAKILYVATVTGDAATTVWTAINASAATPSVPAPQGYLTLTTGTPVITADQVAATTVFYTPDKGNLIPIYNGASLSPTAFSELSLSLVASHAASTIYDIFVFSNAGVLTLVTGPAWTTSTAGAGARGSGASTTELTRINGTLVNAVSMTGRNGSTTFTIGANLATYVGSIFMDAAAGQVTCHRSYGQSRKWGLWNAFNQRRIILQAGDATASWAYGTATVRASNGASANRAAVFQGLQDGPFTAAFDQHIQQAASRGSLIGIGVNSTTAFSGFVAVLTTASSNNAETTLHSYFEAMPSLGVNNVQSLESTLGASVTFQGTQTNMQLSVEWMGSAMPATANLVHELSASTGTGNFTLTAQNGKQRFSTAFGTGVSTNVFDYFISNQDAAEWERGTGHMSATSTLVRDTVIESTNANAAVNFSVGTKNVTNDVPAQNQAAAFFNVGVFGAVADGTTSNRDAQAVQAAVDAAAASALIKTVYIPNAVAGYVFDTTVTVPAGVTIRGDNKWNQGLSRIKPKAGFSAPLFQSAGYGVTRILRMALVGLTLDGSSTTLEAVQVSCQESWFQDLCIRDCFTYGLHMLGVGSAADEQALNNTLLSCYFAGQIGVVEFFNALFIDNHCADTKIINFYGEAAKDALIRDRGYNTQIGSGTHLFGASGDGGGAGVGYYSEFSADKTVSNVYIENTNAEGILIDSGASDAATLNATIGNVNFRNINKGGAASGVIHVKGSNISSLSISGNVVRRDDATSYSTPYFVHFDGITPTLAHIYGNSSASGLITTAETNAAGFNARVLATGSTTLRTLANRFAQTFNVKDYGAVGDGVTDDTAAIQAAITAATAAGGGFVSAPPGTYKVSGVLTIDVSTVHFIGAGRNVTFISTTSATEHVFSFEGTCFDSSIQSLTITSTVTTPTSGAGVSTSDGTGDILIRDIRIENTFDGVVSINGGVIGVVKLVDVDISTIFNDAIAVDEISQLFCLNVNTFQNPSRPGISGLHIQAAGAFYICNSNFAGNNTGILIDPPTGNEVFDGFLSNVEIDSCVSHGLVVDSSGGGSIYNIVFDNFRAGFCGGKGMVFNGANTSHILMSNFTALRNEDEGIKIIELYDSSFNGGSVLGNSATGGTLNGIDIVAGDNLILSKVRSGAYPGVGNNQPYGISIGSGYSGDLLIDKCILEGNATGRISNSSTSTGVKITNCPGFASKDDAWTTKVKTNFESRATTTTLANDSTLQFAMEASKQYVIRLAVHFDTGATADFKFALTGPASPSAVRVVRKHIDPSALTTLVVASEVAYTASTAIAGGAGTAGGWIEMEIMVRNGVNAGTFAFQWAQNTSDATPAIVLDGSYIEYRQVNS